MHKPAKSVLGLLSLIIVASLVLSACNLPLPQAASGAEGDTAATPDLQAVAAQDTAVIGEAEGDVAARNPSDADFAAASVGHVLHLNGQLRTGENSRSRIDFADGTIVRVGPTTTFTLTEINDGGDGLLKRLQLEFGNVWIILNGGALEVDTPSGMASVRGSYLAVDYNEDTGEFWITCLEGTCTMQTDEGEVVLGAGQKATVSGADQPPADEPMSQEDFQDWLDNNPEASLVAFDAPNTVSNFVWFDGNANGTQEDGEFGAPEVGVALYTAADELVASTTTDQNGFYVFVEVAPGDYYLVFDRPSGYAFTTQDAGGFDAFDSDPDASGRTATFTTTGDPADTWDAGLVEQTQNTELAPVASSMDGICYGPDLEDFPAGFNPMTGQPVSNPEDLDLPAMMLSISNFPVSARPQSGLSFAPIIYEIYIGEGMTRFLTVVYGEFPETSTPTQGNHDPSTEPFSYENNLLGNRVWFDENGNGLQDPAEIGIEGVAVHLLDAGNAAVATYYTNPNGYYGFDVLDDAVHAVQVDLPPGFAFSPQDAGDDLLDSDVNPDNGISQSFSIAGDDLSRDAGLVLLPQPQGGAGGGETDAETIAIGDYVWFDANANGLQDEGEYGMPGILVDLDKYDASAGFQPYAQFTTDVNGNYLFANLPADGDYRVTVHPPTGLSLTPQNKGSDDGLDSDANGDGQIVLYNSALTTGLNVGQDAGLVYAGGNPSEATQGDNSAAGGFGPFRSGRVPYEHLLNLFPGGCLIYAGKDPSLDIPVCASVFNSADEGDINANFLGLERLKAIAAGLNQPLHGVNYSGNVFCYGAPAGGHDVPEWIMYHNSNNQTKWVHDPLSNAWLRYNDSADGTGEFSPSTDRLNSSQLQYANVVVMFAPHEVLNSAGTIIDIGIDSVGLFGEALLFRNGQAYDIYWSTGNEEWEGETGQTRPFKFVDAAGNPIALAPGSTWVHIVTLNTCIATGPNAGACLPGANQSAAAFDSVPDGVTPYVRFFAP